MAEQKQVFVSYSHDSEAHKQWVRGLASFLVEHGIDVILDQWDLRYGDDLPAFMEQAVVIHAIPERGQVPPSSGTPMQLISTNDL